jgi:hypothetical protein
MPEHGSKSEQNNLKLVARLFQTLLVHLLRMEYGERVLFLD